MSSAAADGELPAKRSAASLALNRIAISSTSFQVGRATYFFFMLIGDSTRHNCLIQVAEAIESKKEARRC